MSNVCAGIGRGQMTVLDERVAQRRSNFEFYKSKLSNSKGISFHNEPEGSFSNRWLTCIIVNPSETNGITREDIRLALDKKNIESRPLWKPMHLQPVFENYPFYGNGTSARLFENGLCLPSGSNLLTSDLELVSSTILEVLNQK
jgi:dTDP-4-amino-4,6-dideoxygalactose transaminase